MGCKHSTSHLESRHNNSNLFPNDDRIVNPVLRSVVLISATLSRLLLVKRLLLVLLAASLLVPVLTVPTVAASSDISGNMVDFVAYNGDRPLYEDGRRWRYGQRTTSSSSPSSSLTKNKVHLDQHKLQSIRASIVEGLGLQRIPDPSKANVSQAEYERAHREYLTRLQVASTESDRRKRSLYTVYATDQPENVTCHGTGNVRSIDGLSQILSFRMKNQTQLDEGIIVEHATLRLLLGNHDDSGDLDIRIFRPAFRDDSRTHRLITERRIHVDESFEPRWLEFDLTDEVSSWFEDGTEDRICLKLDFHRQNGEKVRRDVASPAINVHTVSDHSQGTRRKRSARDRLISLHKGRRTECRGDSKKCCRHPMDVVFKDLEGFDFIIQPKSFDAGYCKGRCPPRYNPAHHHALLQSLIWKEDRKKAPRPCCAPSKLDQLEILYFDENDLTKLKVSNWKDMKVVECACS